MYFICSMASNSRKRSAPPPELDDYTAVSEPCPTANVHGVVKTLSPVKKGKRSKYFDGVLTDGTSNLRLVGFHSEQQKRLCTFSKDKTPVALQNCELKPSRQGNTMEVILKTATQIVKSPKKIEVLEDEADADPLSPMTVADIKELQPFEKVSTIVKVISKKVPILVAGGKKKQDVLVGDQTSTIAVSLWENYVDTLSQNESYCLQNFVVREYNMKKYLSMPREGATVLQIEDIGDVEQQDSDSEFEHVDSQLCDAQIIGVPQMDSYSACMQCKARVEPLTPPLGRCSKVGCGMLQRFDLCDNQISVKLLVLYRTTDSDAKLYKGLHAFGSTVGKLAGVSDRPVQANDLLSTTRFQTILYNDNNVITGFTK